MWAAESIAGIFWGLVFRVLKLRVEDSRNFMRSQNFLVFPFGGV